MKTEPTTPKTGESAVACTDLLGPAITAESQNGDEQWKLKLLLGTETPNRQGDTAGLSLARTLRMAADCPRCMEAELMAHNVLMRQKYQSMLARWKSVGFPDPGLWPDLHTDLLLVSYLRMAEIIGPNERAHLKSREAGARSSAMGLLTSGLAGYGAVTFGAATGLDKDQFSPGQRNG